MKLGGMMSELPITYRFTDERGNTTVFFLSLDADTFELSGLLTGITPEWSRLSFSQCPHCPLKPDTCPYCPLALNLVGIVTSFEYLISYDEMNVEVETPERTVKRQTTTQKAISSLMGLVSATSGCPYTAFFRPMARFHLALASEEETVYRAVSMYLLGQYYVQRAGGSADVSLDGLKKIYDDIQILNTSMAARLRAASDSDSSINAIVLLDIYARAFPLLLDDYLEKFRPYFAMYL